MSFQSDVTGVLKAEIGPSASVFFKKCMLALSKNPNAVTETDLEEIADWVYEEIRAMIDDKTAFRIQQQILQIPPNAKELRRVPSPLPMPVQAKPRMMDKAPDVHSKAKTDTAPTTTLHTEADEVPDSLAGQSGTIPQPDPIPSAVSLFAKNDGPDTDLAGLLSRMQPLSLEKEPPSRIPESPAGSVAISAEMTRPAHQPHLQTAPSELRTRFSGDDNSIHEIPEESVKNAPDDRDSGNPTDKKPVTYADQLDYSLSRLETEGNNPDLWIEIADLYARSAKFHDAIAAYIRAVELGSETPALWQCLGDSYKKTGQYDDSDLAYARSLEMNPEDPAVWLKRAKALVSRNRFDEALEACDQSLSRNQSSVAAWHYKAFILKKVRRNAEALEIYTYLHQIDPHDENAARQETAIRKLLENDSVLLQQTQ